MWWKEKECEKYGENIGNGKRIILINYTSGEKRYFLKIETGVEIWRVSFLAKNFMEENMKIRK